MKKKKNFFCQKSVTSELFRKILMGFVRFCNYLILDTVYRWPAGIPGIPKSRFYCIGHFYTAETAVKVRLSIYCKKFMSKFSTVHKISKDLYLTLLKTHHLATTWLRMLRLDKTWRPILLVYINNTLRSNFHV